MELSELLFNAVLRIVSIILVSAIFVPLTGALARLRVDFRPKKEDGPSRKRHETASPSSTPPLSANPPSTIFRDVLSPYGVFRMISRTSDIEGWKGVWSGLTITCLIRSIEFSLQSDFGVIRSPQTYCNNNDRLFGELQMNILKQLGRIILVMLVFLPLYVTSLRCAASGKKESTNRRSIVYRKQVDWSNPPKALSEVLSPDERKQPWRIYAIPGLAVTFFLSNVFMALVSFFTDELVSGLAGQPYFMTTSYLFQGIKASAHSRAIGTLILAIWEVLNSLWVSMVQVVLIRLATQRLSLEPFDATAPRTSTKDDRKPLSDTVVKIHPSSVAESRPVLPYKGPLDCMTKIIDEEGFSSLFRGVWVNILDRMVPMLLVELGLVRA